ncbi:MAG: transposase [Anaerolineaceae bacterium]|nr:transposase [Anaerolineaceae bacterium]
MARSARIKSLSGYYHITTRGIGKHVLFEEDSDFLHYLSLLKRFSSETRVSVCAYCLMDNHTHQLIYDPNDNLALFMKKLGTTYANYFNKKYSRVGHLFQNRYDSKPIESESYLLRVFCYILNNPRKAGICSAEDYPWSSYQKYGNPHSFVDTVVLQNLLGSFEEYAAFVAAKYDEDDQDPEKIVRDDSWAKSVIAEVLQNHDKVPLLQYDRKERDRIIRELKQKGLSLRQIERLTGISKGVIQRA